MALLICVELDSIFKAAMNTDFDINSKDSRYLRHAYGGIDDMAILETARNQGLLYVILTDSPIESAMASPKKPDHIIKAPATLLGTPSVVSSYNDTRTAASAHGKNTLNNT